MKINQNNFAILIANKEQKIIQLENSSDEILSRTKIYFLENKQEIENFIKTFSNIPQKNFATFVPNIENIPWVFY